ncbi:MAG: DNA polymerase IV [Desulfarculus sp.]|nr:MAG: DNA polymerase IV [Desulfarculus sp.]
MAAVNENIIAHVDMDAFYAAVEVLDRPELAGRPIIVGGGARGVVSAASYEARAYGVRSAMPMFKARALCPQGVFLPGRMGRYSQVSRVVMGALERFSPLLEPVSVDEAYLDLSGTQRLWGSPAEAGRAIKAAVHQATGLTCSVGLAPVRFLAKIASDRDKPDGLTLVRDLEAFLQTVTLAEVPGVGARARERLAAMGLKRLVELRALGLERLERLMGRFGRRLHELAWGLDPSGVSPGRPVKSVSNELTLEADSGDRELLAAHLLALCQKVARRLRRHGLMGRTVTLKLKHADHRLITRSQSLADHTDQAAEVFAAARGLLLDYRPPGPFRLIGAGVSGLLAAGQGPQPLFDEQGRERSRALSQAEDAIVARFGEGALSRAGALPARRPALDRERPSGHNRVKPK